MSRGIGLLHFQKIANVSMARVFNPAGLASLLNTFKCCLVKQVEKTFSKLPVLFGVILFAIDSNCYSRWSKSLTFKSFKERG